MSPQVTLSPSYYRDDESNKIITSQYLHRIMFLFFFKLITKCRRHIQKAQRIALFYASHSRDFLFHREWTADFLTLASQPYMRCFPTTLPFSSSPLPSHSCFPVLAPEALALHVPFAFNILLNTYLTPILSFFRSLWNVFLLERPFLDHPKWNSSLSPPQLEFYIPFLTLLFSTTLITTL